VAEQFAAVVVMLFVVVEQFAAEGVMLFVVVEQFAAPEELLQEQGKLLPLVHPEREMVLH